MERLNERWVFFKRSRSMEQQLEEETNNTMAEDAVTAPPEASSEESNVAVKQDIPGGGETGAAEATARPSRLSESSRQILDMLFFDGCRSSASSSSSNSHDLQCTPNALETRLSMLVRCSICQLAPLTPYYQCARGYLMCAGCYQVRMSERGICHSCQAYIHREDALRNHVAEATNSQLPVLCQHCGVEYMRGDLQNHQRYDCVARPFECRFRRFGCLWQGTQSQLSMHDTNCPTANLSGAQIREFLQARAKAVREERQVVEALMALLQHPRLIAGMFQHLPQLTEPNVYLPLKHFGVFDQIWLIELVWRPRNVPGLSTLCYRLKLTTAKPFTHNLLTRYSLLRGWYCDAIFVKHICQFEFSLSQLTSPDCVFMEDTNAKCKEMLNEKSLYMILYITLD